MTYQNTKNLLDLNYTKKFYFFDLFLIFCLLFSFRLPIIYNSVILIAIICYSLCLLSRGVSRQLYRIIKTKYVILCFAFIFIIINYVLFVSLYTTEMDLTILRGFISQAITLGCCMLVLSFIFRKNDYDYLYLIRLFLFAFALQSIIQIIAFSFPEVWPIINLFQVEENGLRLKQGYSGARGLALSSELTFGLSSAYGFIFILYFYYLILKKNYKVSDCILFLILFVGSLFTGRTAFAGLLISVLMLPIFISINSIKTLSKYIVLAVFFGWMSFDILVHYLDPARLETLLRFAFEMFYSYSEGNGVSTKSTDHLIEMLMIDPPIKTILIGDGKYTNSDGSYYFHTDSGFFRQILFGGLSFLLLCFIAQLTFIFFPYWKRVLKQKSLFFISFTGIIYFIALHVKGESFMYLKIIQIMIFSLGIVYIMGRSNHPS